MMSTISRFSGSWFPVGLLAGPRKIAAVAADELGVFVVHDFLTGVADVRIQIILQPAPHAARAFTACGVRILTIKFRYVSFTLRIARCTTRIRA